ncbi:MAG: hypothetical protein HYV90_06055 [Candidatus Woesebacteria bacterium]|nr:MAG: hypothetical protein HYV90_06055 [Candidatus Woesebacteria bacterium]
MPSVKYYVPPFYEFLTDNLKGFEMKMKGTRWLTFDSPHMEIRVVPGGPVVATVYYDQVVIAADVTGLKERLTVLAREFEEKYLKSETQHPTIYIDCHYSKVVN